MKSIKMALLAGAAVAVTAAGAQADDLEALKAQIEELNSRVAAMETAPSVPTGYQLIAVSEGELRQTPGLEMSFRERQAYGNRSTVISVLPTADAPAGTTISWSGYARAGVVYQSTDRETDVKFRDRTGYEGDSGNPTPNYTVNSSLAGFDARDVLGEGYARGPNSSTGSENYNEDGEYDFDADDDNLDVKARGQIRVVAETDTAVGLVGVDIEMRGDFNGNGNAEVYWKKAWGYWAMTPELTFGGGYAGSLGNIGYGYDGACTCMYTDNADVAFDPGDTTQMRLSYASGPFSMAVAIEDGGYNNGFGSDEDGDLRFGEDYYDDSLGASGEIKYSGDIFSAELSGVYRAQKEENYLYDTAPDFTVYDSQGNLPGGYRQYGVLTGDGNVEHLWQVGAGVGFALGDMVNISVAAAMGEGPTTVVDDGVLFRGLGLFNEWWGVSALARINMTDEVYAEIGAGYKDREGDFDVNYSDFNRDNWNFDSFDYETYSVMGGLYYNPVDQLTIGVEGEWWTAEGEIEGREVTVGGDNEIPVASGDQDTINIDITTTNFLAAFVARWSF
jgi:hypothetical protein